MRRPIVYVALALIAIILSGYYFFGIEMTNSVISNYLEQSCRDSKQISSNSADPSYRVKIRGRVLTAREKNPEYHQLTLEIVSINGNSLPGEKSETVLLNVYNEFPESVKYPDLVGRSVSAYTVLSLPQTRRNPGCFDYRLYLKSEGIFWMGKCRSSEFSVIGDDTNWILNFLSRKKASFISIIRSSAGEKIAAIVSAMAFGDKSELDEDIYKTFQQNGTAHILAVSGLHIGIIYAFISFIWRGKKRGAFSIIMIVCLLIYSVLADFSPSVMRAVIMITIHITAKLLHRRYDLLSAAALAAVIMLLHNPMQLFSIGFQLSFGAAAVLAVLIPIIPKGLIGKMVLAVSFQLVMAPYNAYVFNYFSLIGFVLNIVVILLVSIILPICITMLLIYFVISCTVCQVLLDFGSKLLASLVDLLMRFNEISYRPGYSTFEVTSPSLLGLWLFYGIFFLCISEHFRIIFIRKRRSALALALVGVISASLIAAYVNDDGFGRCKAVFVDVGQGDCLLLKDIEGKNYLFDGGGKEGFAGNKTGYDVGEKILKPVLLKNGIKKIDAAFVTHLHTDHYDGVRSLAKLGMVDKLCVYEANALIEEKILSDTSLASDEIIYACKGDYFKLGEGASVEVIWPERMSKDKYAAAVSDDADENLISLIMRVEVDGCSILVTGDIGQDGEHKLVDIYGKKLKTEILKTSHHGSKYSSSDSFLDAVSPLLAVIQVGKNTYGHPTKEVLNKLTERGIITYRNDYQGAVGIETEQGVIKRINTMIR